MEMTGSDVTSPKRVQRGLCSYCAAGVKRVCHCFSTVQSAILSLDRVKYLLSWGDKYREANKGLYVVA